MATTSHNLGVSARGRGFTPLGLDSGRDRNDQGQTIGASFTLCAFILLGYKDPAERFLAATAQAYDLTLGTSDRQPLRVPGIETLANT